MNFAETLKQSRWNKGLTQLELSKATSIPKATIANYEQGIRTPTPWLQKIILKEIDRL